MKVFYLSTINQVRQVKHSVVYKNDKIAGLYIPKELLPIPFPQKIEISLGSLDTIEEYVEEKRKDYSREKGASDHANPQD